jgi:MATE family multidrug resistance protein
VRKTAWDGLAVSEFEMDQAASRPVTERAGTRGRREAGLDPSLPRAYPAWRPWLLELQATAVLSAPLIVTSIVQMAINATTMVMVGRLGPGELAATALANGIYNSFLVFSMGLVSAVAPMLANERGRNRHAVRELRRTVRQGFWASLALSLPAWLILWQVEPMLDFLGQDPASAHHAAFFMHYLQWGLLPQLLYMVLRSFLSALERPFWTLLAAFAAVLVNIGIGVTLIFGRFGVPALGLEGAGIANACASLTMFLVLACVVTLGRRFRRYEVFGRFWRADWPRFFELMRLGWPIAITIAFETTIFSAAVIMMGLISQTAVAAHAIALQIGSLGYMVPTGIAQAATVRVGMARGAGDRAWIRRAGWTGYWLALCASGIVALLVVTRPRFFAGIFIDVDASQNAAVVALAMSFLGVAALFLLTDCMQVIAAGMLRGLYDTRMPMLIAGIGYWIIGLPLGALLAFHFGVGGIGIWIGLASGLGAVGLIMTARWVMRERLGLLGGIP